MQTKGQNVPKKTEQFLVEGYLEDNPKELQLVSIAVYRLLLKGKPVTTEQISEITGLGEEKIPSLFKLVPPSGYVADENGGLTEFIGLSLNPAPHEFIVEGKTFYT